jgi:hypothetical protein
MIHAHKQKVMANLKIYRNIVLLHKVRHRLQLGGQASNVDSGRGGIPRDWMQRVGTHVDRGVDATRLQSHRKEVGECDDD